MALLPLGGSIGALVAFHIWTPPVSFLATLLLVLPYWGWRRLHAASVYFADELRSLEESVGRSVLADSRQSIGLGGDVVLRQMTLLAEARRRISDLRRFVSDMLSNYPDPVLVTDRDGRIVTANESADQFARRLGVSDAAGASIEIFLEKLVALDGEPGCFWPPPDMDEDNSSPSEPVTATGPGGQAFELRYTPTRSAGDELTGWILHLADITSLVSAMRQREEALQLLSHDMRSPQSAILATLNHPDFHAVPTQLRKRIESHARRTLQMADAFVRLAKAESAEYDLEMIDLGHLIQDAADAVWPLAQAAKVEVSVELPEVEYVVLADRGLMTRALVNLLDNAVKFSPAGRTVSCRLWLDELAGRPAVACEIADHAGGIPQADLADLFRKFASSKNSLSGSTGIGLGLALVHTVVTRLDGVITCHSVEGEGTAFTITMPLQEEVLESKADLVEA
jgi:signal transduction histidine kinase